MKEINGFIAIVEYQHDPGRIRLLGKPSDISPQFGSNGLVPYSSLEETLHCCKDVLKASKTLRIEQVKLDMKIAETLDDEKILAKESPLVVLAYYESEEEGAEFFGPRIGQLGCYTRAQFVDNGAAPFITDSKGSAYEKAVYAASEIRRQTFGKAGIATYKLRKI